MSQVRWYQNGTMKTIATLVGLLLLLGNVVGTYYVSSYRLNDVEEQLNSLIIAVDNNQIECIQIKGVVNGLNSDIQVIAKKVGADLPDHINLFRGN